MILKESVAYYVNKGSSVYCCFKMPQRLLIELNSVKTFSNVDETSVTFCCPSVAMPNVLARHELG